MTRIFKMLLAATLLSVGQAYATTIDFDDYNSSVSIPIGDHYADQGVIFGSSWDFYGYKGDEAYYPPHSGHTTTLLENFANAWIDFDGPVSDVSAYFNVYVYTMTLSAFDAAHNLLGSLTLSPTSQPTPGGMQQYAFNFGNISRLELSGAGLYFHNMDDLSFTRAAVPEPASLAVFALGLIGLGVARRSSKRI